jgi:YesN/AraC family two-component response regulator
LVGSGYSVKTAKNGDEALEIFKSCGTFDVLITDIMMPGKLLGPALAKAARSIDPELPCVFLSGYATQPNAPGNEFRSSDICLMKPVGRTDLLYSVSKAIQTRKKVSE